ncbi:MAG TPA: phage tail tube protein [Planctomycetaceae bacterium]|jgi:hypothetical protein
MSTKYSAKGLTLLLSISSVYTAIGGVSTLAGPDAEVERVGTTALDSGVGKEKLPTGYTDGGTVTGTCFFDPANVSQKACTALLAAPAVSAWKTTYPDVAPTSWTYSGILFKFTPKGEVGQVLTADFSIDVTGLVTGW